MFDKDSGLVQVWVRLIREGVYTTDKIPNISNLREIVINELGAEEK